MAKRKPSKELSEKAFLDAYDPSAFDRPSVAVDVALLSVVDGALFTLLLARAEHPFKGKWSLPGGFVRLDEPLDAAARRALATKGKLTGVFLEQLCTFGDPRRDPRMRIISVAYYALVDRRRFEEAAARSQGDLVVARIDVPWEGETGGPVDVSIGQVGLRPSARAARAEDTPTGSTEADFSRFARAHDALAFDHAEILGTAVKRIRGKLDYSPIGFQLLGETFTLLDLQRVHETVLGRPLNKDSFRRRMLASGQLEATGEMERDVDHRPAELYRFVKRSAV